MERSATNHNIPADAAPLAHRDVRRKVESLVSAVDAYLRRLEDTEGFGPKVVISLNGFAHQQKEVDPETIVRHGFTTSPPAKPKGRRRGRPAE